MKGADNGRDRREKSKAPVVAVGVTTYNHAAYINECLESVVSQTGGFKLHIIICDDCSDDGADGVIKEFLEKTEKNDRVSIDYIRNKVNLGALANSAQLISEIKKRNPDYFTIIEGDDYYFCNYRIDRCLQFCEENPRCAIVFHPLILYYQEGGRFSIHQPNEGVDNFSTEVLIRELNPMGSMSATFYRAYLLDYINDDIFEKDLASDWCVNIFLSLHGEISYIKSPMVVHRKHPAGAWSGVSPVEQYELIVQGTHKLDRYLDYAFSQHFEYVRSKCMGYINDLIYPLEQQNQIDALALSVAEQQRQIDALTSSVTYRVSQKLSSVGVVKRAYMVCKRIYKSIRDIGRR